MIDNEICADEFHQEFMEDADLLKPKMNFFMLKAIGSLSRARNQKYLCSIYSVKILLVTTATAKVDNYE